jgi:phospholipid/cholesterol/gamma-HCH transport system permease protein
MREPIPPTLEVVARAEGARWVVLDGDWRVEALCSRLPAIERQLAHLGEHQGLWWDLERVTALDSVAAALLWKYWRGARPPGLAVQPEHEAFFERLGRVPLVEPPSRRPATEVLVQLGQRALDFLGHLLRLLELFGQLVFDVLRALRRPSWAPWQDFSAALYRCGTTALPITALVGFLIGVVLSYLSAQQLRTFGANIFIVDLLGISILRELGPLLAAILVAGRSGSSITAQIGVMRLTQELDALAAMGISRTFRLVLPRVVALAVALPLLVLWTDALALAGGILAAQQELGVGFRLFLDKLPDAVPISNLWLGLVKGVVFGGLIGLVACHFGLRVEPNTRSLGAGTTRSVVVAITLVIVADAIFAIVTSRVGLP